MEVPGDVLSSLRCSRCPGYLSCAPVYLLENDKRVCGRCKVRRGPGARRVLPYEDLAEMMKFPCLYMNEGCTKQMYFNANGQHERMCAFKPFKCPIAEPGTCIWVHGRHYLLDHCKEHHPRNVAENYVQLRYDYKSSRQNYLLTAFEHLFLVQSEKIVYSLQVHHSVRLIGDAGHVGKYEFCIEIVNDKDTRLKIPGRVLAQGDMTLQENGAVLTDLEGLHEEMRDFNSILFTITVHERKQVRNKNTWASSDANPLKK